MTRTAFHLVCLRYARIALTFVLMAWVGVVNLPPSVPNFHAFDKEALHRFLTARFAVPGTPRRSLAQQSAPRAVQYTEAERKSESEAAMESRLSARPNSKTTSFVETQSLSVISPDHLIELPGTPPPPLRL